MPCRYECHCTARYTGNNCEVDAGDPCRSAPCQHAGRCVEDSRGDYTCVCTPDYHGTRESASERNSSTVLLVTIETYCSFTF